MIFLDILSIRICQSVEKNKDKADKMNQTYIKGYYEALHYVLHTIDDIKRIEKSRRLPCASIGPHGTERRKTNLEALTEVQKRIYDNAPFEKRFTYDEVSPFERCRLSQCIKIYKKGFFKGKYDHKLDTWFFIKNKNT